MRNKLQSIKNSWTYNHKSLIVIASLLLALYYPAYIEPHMPTWPTVEATYTKQATTTPATLDTEIARRTLELYEQNRDMDLERYRLDAISELNKQLQSKVLNSPHIDYKQLETEYGY